MGVQLSYAAEENLALNKSYTLEPAPNYDLCTDADDTVQLTDGKTTNEYFWTQQGTVGWRGVSFGLITVDLGRIEPISGFEFTTAAGAGGVEFPVSVRVDVSDDGETYYESADLVADTREALGEFPTKYAIVCLKSKPVRTRGRYVRIMAIESGPFLFCDEIRVIPGDASLLTADLKRVPVSGTPADVYRERKMAISIDKRIQTDCETVMKIVGDSEINLSAEERVSLKNELASSASGAASWDVPQGFRAVLPFNENHAGVYRVLSKAWNAAGFRGVIVSPANVWDYTNRFDYPKRSESPEISLAFMQKEPRAAVLNAYNATQTPVDLKFKVKENPALKVKAYRAVWTDTSVLEPVLDALVPVTPDGSGVLTLDAVPSGLVTQLWLVFEAQSGATSVQKLESSVTCENTGETFPVRATVYPREFPQQTRLLLGGWDYTNGGGTYNVNRTNLDSFLETVRAGRVNAPWGSPSLLENCEVNPDDLSVKINTDMFDEWIERWPKSVLCLSRKRRLRLGNDPEIQRLRSRHERISYRRKKSLRRVARTLARSGARSRQIQFAHSRRADGSLQRLRALYRLERRDPRGLSRSPRLGRSMLYDVPERVRRVLRFDRRPVSKADRLARTPCGNGGVLSWSTEVRTNAGLLLVFRPDENALPLYLRSLAGAPRGEDRRQGVVLLGAGRRRRGFVLERILPRRRDIHAPLY